MAKGRKTGGRGAGTPNRATADVKTVAREYGPRVVEKLWGICEKGESDQAKISAARELLDRGYGKPAQPVSGDADGEPVVVKHIVEWLK
jgi:hypothetical protein